MPSYLIKTFFCSVSPCFRDRHDEFQEDDFRWIQKSTNLDVDYNWSCLLIWERNTSEPEFVNVNETQESIPGSLNVRLQIGAQYSCKTNYIL